MRPTTVLGALLAVLLPVSGLEAQGGPTTIQFSFSNPGARSLGLGGAFVALADDATASFANPAGLTQLTRPEVSLEGRSWSYSTPFTEGGRTSGEATGVGLDGPIRTATGEFDTTALSFASFVYPGRRWTAAASHHRSAEFEVRSATQGLFTDLLRDDPQPTCLGDTGVCRYPDFGRDTRVDIETTTLSIAYRFGDRLSLGVGVSHFDGSVVSVNDSYTISEVTLPMGFFGPNAYVPEALVGTDTLAFDDSDWQLNFGFLYFPTRQWSLGGVVRPGASFGGSGIRVSGPALDPPYPTGTVAFEDPRLRLDVPDVYGLGVAYRSKAGTWTVSFEWDRVHYSSILESIGRSPLIDTDEVSLDDVSELRLGFEYAFLRWTPLVALRAGVWRNPDHTIRTFEDDPLEQVLLPGGEDTTHAALGVGIVFRSLQIDLAVDLSDLVDTGSLSLIYQF